MSTPRDTTRVSAAQAAYRASSAFKALGKRMAQRNLEAFRDRPRCGAKRKRDGEPCQRPVLKDRGRCKLHGGASPRADRWHTLVFPKADDPRAEQKLQRKLAQLARAKRKRERRIADMSADDLEVYRAWQRTHQPGPAGPRARRRAEQAHDPALAKIIAAALAPRSAPAISAEIQKIEAEIARLQSETAALNAAAAAFDTPKGSNGT